MDGLNYQARLAALEKEIRILKQKLARSDANRIMLEEALDTHWMALIARNAELEESWELIRQSEARYRQLAIHDILTGLPNRAHFQEQLNRAIAHAKRLQTRFGILYIDLDWFKTVNDNWGHEAGDVVLRETADRLKSSVRAEDTVARIGGDEFAILMEDIQENDDLDQTAKRILDRIAEPFLFLDNICRIGASIGISIYPRDGEETGALLKKADTAMYEIKKSGRNNYQFYAISK